eukprot:162136-Pyramimonas_sp.AAC.1
MGTGGHLHWARLRQLLAWRLCHRRALGGNLAQHCCRQPMDTGDRLHWDLWGCVSWCRGVTAGTALSLIHI